MWAFIFFISRVAAFYDVAVVIVDGAVAVGVAIAAVGFLALTIRHNAVHGHIVLKTDYSNSAVEEYPDIHKTNCSRYKT